MKKGVYLLLLISGFLLSSLETEHVAEGDPVAVVELFTSQGCSSCPAADELLSTLVKKENSNIFGLSFHVSYWNYLGWKDPYSSEEFTKRQRKYSEIFKLGRIYTPQMVVNGQHEFVGSNQYQARKVITKVLKDSAPITLHSKLISSSSEKAIVEYEIEGSLNNAIINLAVVEKDITTRVKRGENGGRILKHDNVVRAFVTQTAINNSSIEVNLPRDLIRERSSLIIYAQQEEDLKVLGAEKIKL